ncbi:MAG: chromate efflux transporter, partial [Chloroflexi bacterium]|nr:chromate efflux transporter [Chloroflexota bacterium]
MVAESPVSRPTHRESLVGLFLRFLKFGFLAWGGPVAQIGLIKHELVDRERWIPVDHFNRVLGIYQLLPGPEAHELCVYFGYMRHGRIGGLLAGLGFMLPGFVLMFALSWFYVTYGLQLSLFSALFYGLKPAVAALVVLAVYRIGRSAISDAALATIAALALGATWIWQLNFAWVLLLSGLAYLFWHEGRKRYAAGLLALGLVPATMLSPWATSTSLPLLASIFWSGLKIGLLTFGGAYTAIPLLQQEAVYGNGWLTNAQYLDGIALGGILPAPLIIFSTFVGYLAGGPGGAILMTLGVFLPAFSFTLIGHTYLERIVHHPGLQLFLKGLTAGVVGLIAAAAIQLARVAIVDMVTLGLGLIALVILLRWRASVAVA